MNTNTALPVSSVSSRIAAFGLALSVTLVMLVSVAQLAQVDTGAQMAAAPAVSATKV